MHTSILTAITLTLTLFSQTNAYVLPIPPPSINNAAAVAAAIADLSKRADPASQLLQIAPSANTCSGASFPSECATASEAVGPIIAGFSQYQITTAPEQAALLSWMAFESGDFKFNQNHFPAPGRPGQGTRNMMMPNFVQMYAASIPAVAAQVAGKDAAAVLALVQPDQYSFASAAWFYSTQCSAQVKQAVRTGGQQGWQSFITGCVQTSLDGRLASWQAASRALGVPGV